MRRSFHQLSLTVELFVQHSIGFHSYFVPPSIWKSTPSSLDINSLFHCRYIHVDISFLYIFFGCICVDIYPNDGENELRDFHLLTLFERPGAMNATECKVETIDFLMMGTFIDTGTTTCTHLKTGSESGNCDGCKSLEEPITESSTFLGQRVDDFALLTYVHLFLADQFHLFESL